MKVRSIKNTYAVPRTRSPYGERQYVRTRVRRTERFKILRCTVRLTLRYGSEIQNEYEVRPFTTSEHTTDMVLVAKPMFLGMENHLGQFPEASDRPEGQE